ncbi:MAG: COQ9 family protein [Pseudomonadota bacterium]
MPVSETFDASQDARAPSARLRETLLDALLEIAPFEGWTRASLKEAAKASGLSSGEVSLAVPGGITDLLEAFAARADNEAARIIGDADLGRMKVRERITFAVRARIEAVAPHKEAARRAAEAAMAPWRVGLAHRLVWRTADVLWRSVGDKSTDGNWYSKRAILSGVLASTLVVWFASDDENAWRHLDARIDNVMQFEKVKARAKKFAARAPNPMDLLGGRRGTL